MKTISLLGLISVVGIATAAVPAAIFHGFGDMCLFPEMWEFTDDIAAQTEAYAKCVEIGYGSTTSVFENFETQAETACNNVLADPNFQGEFNVLGLSQGGLIARHIAERCPVKGKVRNLITLGGLNMGVSASPGCLTGMFCSMMNFVIKNLVYFKEIQDFVGPAGYFSDPNNNNKKYDHIEVSGDPRSGPMGIKLGYFRDPNHLQTYLDDSVFLPYVNGKKQGNMTEAVKSRFTDLNAALFVMFTEYTVIFPRETAWFWQLQADGTILPVYQTEFYQKDFIGLRALEEAGKVEYQAFEGNHLQFTEDQIKNVIVPFLKK